MMGTTIVALPYGVATTGIGLSLVIIALMGVISCFTCLVIVWYGKGGAEFSSVVASYLGRPPQYVAWFMSTGIIAGAAIVYHILMQESLYQLVGAVLTGANTSAEWWKRPYAALIPLVVYPICNFKDMSALVKVNSIGFVFLWYTLLFIVYHGVNVIVQGKGFVITTTEASQPFDPITGNLYLNVAASGNFGALGGMMMLSFFIHNCIQPILKNAQTDTQYTDIIIAYDALP
jgi:amino acid permease